MARLGTAIRIVASPLALLPLLLAGCGTKEMGVDEDEQHFAGAACEQLDAQGAWASVYPFAEDDDSGGRRTGNVSGIVENRSRASSGETGATFRGGIGMLNGEVDTFLIRVSTFQLAELQLALPTATPEIEIGATVSVRFDITTGGWLPPQGFVEVRNAAGELLVWVAQSFEGFGPALSTPELTVAGGELLCTVTARCGSSRFYGLSVTAGEAHEEVGYGAAQRVGDYMVLHGGNHESTPAQRTECQVADGFYGRIVSVAAVSRSGAAITDDDDAGTE